MKKFALIILSLFVLSCSEEEPLFEFSTLPIDEAKTPVSFTYKTSDTIVLKYTLPNACFSFNNVYYEYDRNSRIVGINVIKDLEKTCNQATIEKEIKLPIHVLQEEDYIFKFYKGKDANGDLIFEEITVPVN
ncbi:hypothetical protein [Polaribacter sp. MED152]|uniref:hypothetical protein n=1 Tax=Polaribacter sp. MED152 TaxID=313598 RepID=UPI000068C51D|nr:hypothetical protein [Polaribacter sp. MED152]EAQ42708.1 hypothetical protein MED152_08300 [Polaribacter sp. MED152]